MKKKFLGKFSLIAYQLVQIAALVSFQLPQPAMALEMKINRDKLKFKELACDAKPNNAAEARRGWVQTVGQFCTKYFGTGELSPSGGTMATWSPADDQACYELGAPTNGGYTANNEPSAAATGTPPKVVAAAGACTSTMPESRIKVCKGDQGCLQRACTAAIDNKTQCSLHNSQIESHCIAYLALNGEENAEFNGGIQGAKNADYFMIGLNTAVAATCLAECVSPSSAVGATCTFAAMSQGIVELGVIATSEHDGVVGKYINGFASTVVIGGQAAIGVGKLGKGGWEALSNSWNGTSGDAINAERSAACATSALFAIMAGVRVVSAANMEEVAGKECENINKLLSEATTFDGAGGDGASGSGGGGWNGGGSGNGSGADGMGGAGGNTQRVVGTDTNGQIRNCQAGGQSFNECAKQAGVQLGAQDADLVSKMGKAPMLPLSLADIKKAVKEHGSAGLLASALPAGAGDAGAALAALSKAAQDNPKELAGLGNLSSGSTYAGGGGGSGGGGSKSDASNPFAGLFGAKDGGGGASSAGQATFGARAPANDIWHTGTTQNLFEIVSGKVSQVVSRVMAK